MARKVDRLLVYSEGGRPAELAVNFPIRNAAALQRALEREGWRLVVESDDDAACVWRPRAPMAALETIPGVSLVSELQGELQELQQQLDQVKRERAAARGQVTKLKRQLEALQAPQEGDGAPSEGDEAAEGSDRAQTPLDDSTTPAEGGPDRLASASDANADQEGAE